MDRFDRIFELNRILQGARQPVSRRRLQEELECSRATVKRIIEDMRLYLNAPIVYDRERNGYRYDQGEGEMYELPGLWFNASEIRALLTMQHLLVGLQPGLLEPHVKPLLARLRTLLGSGEHSADEIERRIRILHLGARAVQLPHFESAASGVLGRKRLDIVYRGRGSDQTTSREISPQRLVHYRENWYVDAWCHLRNDLRSFSLDAIQRARLLDKAAKTVPDSELDEILASGYGIFSGRATAWAKLRFTPERARWVGAEQWHPQQKGQFEKNGSYVLELPYADPRELVMDILRHGPEVEVLEPAELRRAVQGQLEAAAARYKK